MPKCSFRAGPALFTALLLAACGAESSTGPRALSPESLAAAKQPGTCTFLTPNGKTHTVPAASGKCPSPKPAARVAGSYEITRYTFRQLEWVGDDRVISALYDIADFLGDGGAEFELTLNPDGTTVGRFYAPPTPGESGSGADMDLAGTWRLDGDTVIIDTTEDSFFDQLPYTYGDGTLTAGPGTIGDADDPLYVEEIILTRR